MSRKASLLVLAMDLRIKADEKVADGSFYSELIRLSMQCQALAGKQPAASVEKSVENPAKPRFLPCPISCT